MTLTEQELYQLVFNRNLSENLLKETQIKAAFQKWVVNYVGAEFLEVVKDDTEFIDGCIKPVWAWGVVYSNFHYLANNITDKGIIAMLIEGTASVLGMDKLSAAKAEILDNIFSLMKALDECAKDKYEDDYDGLLIDPVAVTFFGQDRYNKTPY